MAFRKSLLLLTVISLGSTSELSRKGNSRAARLFSLFNVVEFRNEECTTTGEALSGTCMTAAECSSIGGVAQGNCAAGFGTCCLVTTSACGGTVTRNCTYIQNAGFPAAITAPQTCKWTIRKCATSVCFHRLDFVRYQDVGDLITADVANRGDCLSDQLTFVTGSGEQAPTLCGTLTGMHIYLEPGQGGGDSCITTTYTNTGNRNYRIKVTQIPCGSTYTPPSGCDQYFLENAGQIKSYNFPNFHLNDQMYSTCIRRNVGFCSIQYSAPNANSFMISGPVDLMMKSSNGDVVCKDYVMIPLSSNGDNMCSFGKAAPTTPTPSVTRYCGRRLNCISLSETNAPIVSTAQPFIVNFFTDGKDNIVDGADSGYCLNYQQLPC